MYQNKKQPNYTLWTILLLIFISTEVVCVVVTVAFKNTKEPQEEQIPTPTSYKPNYTPNKGTYTENKEEATNSPPNKAPINTINSTTSCKKQQIFIPIN
ncbi:MAG: putative secreted protein [Candidatus Phytoplasma asteris]|nr:MAG: putative secreted protein [Periwinkle leaf yellowing phytoplasma]WEX19479.1 MAG: putative secreted protein [Candidatus Phytoplasma asteris]